MYDFIDSEMVYSVAVHIKGGSGPSGIDVNGWRRIVSSRKYRVAGGNITKAILHLFLGKYVVQRQRFISKSIFSIPYSGFE